MSVRRRSGVLVPLFSLTSTRSWGIGEFADLPAFARWAQSAGQCFVQILPITEIPGDRDVAVLGAHGDGARSRSTSRCRRSRTSWRSAAKSSMSTDDKAAVERDAPRPCGSSIRTCGRSRRSGCAARSSDSSTSRSAGAHRAAPRVCRVRARPKRGGSTTTRCFRRSAAATRRSPGGIGPSRWRAATPRALAEARADAARRDRVPAVRAVGGRGQWAAARRACRRRADLRRRAVHDLGRQPRRVDAAERVPARCDRRRSAGCVQRYRPGLGPAAVALGGDGAGRLRVDGPPRPPHRAASSTASGSIISSACIAPTSARSTRRSSRSSRPTTRLQQLQLGERLVGIYQESGAEIIAEDLGTVPDFVRRSLQRMNVPGFKVLRWERDWTAPGQPFVDPATYPEASVATTGTHDIEPLAQWWEDRAARRARLAAGDAVGAAAPAGARRHARPAASPRRCRAT